MFVGGLNDPQANKTTFCGVDIAIIYFSERK